MASKGVAEVRVRLHAPLRDARLVDPSAPLPPVAQPAPPPDTPDPPFSREPPASALADDALAEGSRLNEDSRRLDEERLFIEKTLAAVGQKVHELHEVRRQDRLQLRRTAIELGVTLAARLLHDRIATNDFPVETIVREMIDAASTGSVSAPIVVHLHPADLALLRQRLEGGPLLERPEGLSYAADPALGRGDCRVEAGDALLLSQLDVQLAEMRRGLLRSLGHAVGASL